jgi:hypothetical protein
MQYWQSIQRQALASSLSLYAPRVVAAIGLSTFAGLLAKERDTARAARLNIIGIETVAGGRLVTAEMLPTVGAKVVHTFFLRRPMKRWRIMYDTVLAQAIRSYVQGLVQRGIDRYAARPSVRAVRAGNRAIEAYRRSSPSLVRGTAR